MGAGVITISPFFTNKDLRQVQRLVRIRTVPFVREIATISRPTLILGLWFKLFYDDKPFLVAPPKWFRECREGIFIGRENRVQKPDRRPDPGLCVRESWPQAPGGASEAAAYFSQILPTRLRLS